MIGLLRLHADYFVWHYSRGFADVFSIWRNLLSFTLHFFSMPLLLRTWFSKFRQLGEERTRGFHPGEFFSAILINVIMRMVGFLLRTALLLIGTIFLAVLLVVGPVVLAVWLVFPFAAIGVLVTGVILIIG